LRWQISDLLASKFYTDSSGFFDYLSQVKQVIILTQDYYVVGVLCMVEVVIELEDSQDAKKIVMVEFLVSRVRNEGLGKKMM
jgi:alanine racemase